ncbi:hypothetical protein MKZ38_004570 [Zalerion maritima]|uniref:Something about silencing protein 4 domain-containing protein n=1 Tax=Zalerion maritima TaxID=339359 RepID=A0AAD5RWG5_9PEZI|nr:hypothetical protein MKZ38_004570 [Zalerion maritima]
MTRRKTEQSVATQSRARTVQSSLTQAPQQQRSKRPLNASSMGSDQGGLKAKRAKISPPSKDATLAMEGASFGAIAGSSPGSLANRHHIKLAPPPPQPSPRTTSAPATTSSAQLESAPPPQQRRQLSARRPNLEPTPSTSNTDQGTTKIESSKSSDRPPPPGGNAARPGRNSTSRAVSTPSNGIYTDATLALIDAPTKPKSAAAANPPTIASATAKKNSPVLPKHRAKVHNGIRHELDRLKPSDADRKVEESGGRRKLRSTENPRFKSDLSQYFQEYDQIIGNDPLEEHLLEIDTPIVLVDSHPLPKSARSQPDPPMNFADHLASSYNGVHAQVVDLRILDNRVFGDTGEDPLADGLYETFHKRQERNEKSIRNIEKNKAQHEKERVQRLLESLQGQDWLRVLGIHGINTEARKKQYRPARQYFIKGCENILAKFKEWSKYEKSKRYDKGRSKSPTSTPPPGHGGKRGAEGGTKAGGKAKRQRCSATRNSLVEDSEDGDIDASVAKQLQEESAARSKSHGGKSRASAGSKVQQQTKEPVESPKPQEFTSFFKKAYQRDAALKGRRTRHPLAWGHPIPEVEEEEFRLPDDFLDAEALKALSRRRRQARREKRDTLATKK